MTAQPEIETVYMDGGIVTCCGVELHVWDSDAVVDPDDNECPTCRRRWQWKVTLEEAKP